MTVRDNWFEDWFNTAYYHKLYFERDEREAAVFINKLLDYLKPPPGSLMLDVGSGRGRHARLLAAKGYDVTGIDLAPDSIANARQYESDNLHFFLHDIRLPFRVNYYDYAFNFFTSFGFFKSDREHYNAIRTIANALKPGGMLVLDYLNVHYTEDHLVYSQEKKIDDISFYITRYQDEDHFYKKIEIEDEQLEAPLMFTERVAKYTLGDFNDMFAFHYLQVQEVFGDYAFNNYDVKKSPRLMMVVKKVDKNVSKG